MKWFFGRYTDSYVIKSAVVGKAVFFPVCEYIAVKFPYPFQRSFPDAPDIPIRLPDTFRILCCGIITQEQIIEHIFKVRL